MTHFSAKKVYHRLETTTRVNVPCQPYQGFSPTESQIVYDFAHFKWLVLENYLELGGGILQVSRLGVETLENDVFLIKKAVRSWIKRLVANLFEKLIF